MNILQISFGPPQACAALHNLTIDLNRSNVEVLYPAPRQPVDQLKIREEGRAVRDNIARNYIIM